MRRSSASTRSSGTPRSTGATSRSRSSSRWRGSCSAAFGDAAALVLYVVVVAIWFGLVFSFSQSSFMALSVGVVVAAAVAWGRRAMVALVVLGLLTVAAVLATPQVRGEIAGKSRSGLNKVTSGRSNLVSQGIRIAVDHPVAGIGVGGFRRAYAERTGVKGDDPKRVASHTTPITVAAEGGIVGLALFCWLVAGGARSDAPRARPRLHVANVARDRRRPRRDRRAQLLLCRLLRGSDDLGACSGLIGVVVARAEEEPVPAGG